MLKKQFPVLSTCARSGFVWCLFLTVCLLKAQAQDKTFSGPQPGERVTSFQTTELRGEHQGETVDPIKDLGGKAATLVFVHGMERSMAPLMRVIDTFGDQHQEKLQTIWVFLSDDAVGSRQRLPLVGRSLKTKGRMLLSNDGIEGPGNYGLNKECLLTVLGVHENRVAANFALVQPGIADAESVIGSLSKMIGLENPPSIESLSADMRMERERGNMRQRVQEGQRGQDGRPPQRAPLPGAAPTDEGLISLLRQFIQKSNSDARVDKVLEDVRAYIKDDQALKTQAMNGWIRVLAVKYGTEYAQSKGQVFVDDLKKELSEQK